MNHPQTTDDYILFLMQTGRNGHKSRLERYDRAIQWYRDKFTNPPAEQQDEFAVRVRKALT